MPKLKITMDAFVELEDGEHIVKFVVKTLTNPPAHLREKELDVPHYTTKILDNSQSLGGTQ
jgi:hypothetical protein